MQIFYLAPVNADAGLTSVSLGLVRSLEREGFKVGFVKPVAQSGAYNEQIELSTHFAEVLCHIAAPAPIAASHCERLLREGKRDQLMEEVVAVVEQAGDACDVLIVEGLVADTQTPFATSVNAEIARNLSADVLFVTSAAGHEAGEIVDKLELAAQQYAAFGMRRLGGFLLNKAPHGHEQTQLVDDIDRLSTIHLRLLGVIPYEARFNAPRLIDVAQLLGLRIDHPGHITRTRVHDIVIGARAVENLIERLRPGALLVTPGDRQDVLMAAALAALRGVPLAGVLLTCGALPHPRVEYLIQPAKQTGLPVLSTDHDTFHIAAKLSRLSRHVPADDRERMEQIIEFVAEQIDSASLVQQIGQPSERRLSPPAFRHQLVRLAREAGRRIVLPEGDEPRTIRAAAVCRDKGIARCVLLGKPELIRQSADALGVTLEPGIDIVDPDEVRVRYVDAMVELRRGRGLSAHQAEQELEDNVVLGTMMLALDEVDGLVSGAVHTTANTIRPALQLIKTAPGSSIVSSVFFMLMPEQVLVYGDCAVNPDPNAEELADIAIQSADSARAFGIEPRVAMISYSTGSSGSGSDVEKVREATRLARAKRPELLIDGPMQYDAASVESVGRQKAPDSPVAGRANVFVFPDLNTGNTTYKAVQRSANVVSVGPMLQGLKKPVNDLSRGALVDDIVYTIALTAIQASQIGAPAPAGQPEVLACAE